MMSTQNSILLIDPIFNPIASEKCNLLLKVGMDSFSYAIIDKEMNKVVAVFDEQECGDVSKKLNERLKNDTYLGLTFNEVKIAIHTKNNISIPNILYNREELTLNTSFFQQSHSGNLYTTTHANFGFTSVFSYTKLIDELINHFFSNSKKYHANTTLLKLAENINDTSLILDFTANSLQVLYVKDKRLIFQQSYEIEDSGEFNYYMLLIINTLSINPNETSVYISGIIHEEDEKYTCLKKYFSGIQFLNFVDFNLDQQVLEDMPSHYYTTLLALDQCV